VKRWAVTALLVGGCASAPAPRIELPHAYLSDAASERMHDRCEVRAVKMLAPADIDRAGAEAHATFAELVYAPSVSAVGVVLVRCPAGAVPPPSFD
jgi:hypothetical protein